MNFPLQDFHFLRPEWFIALIPLLSMLLLIRRYRKSQSGWQSVIPPHLYNHLISGKAIAKKQAQLSLLGWGWLLAVFALAGPTWERLPQPVFQVQQGNVVLIDMSLSMRATDVTPDRLTRAKYKAIDLINAVDEGEMGLVAYAGDAFAISPLTTDAANLTALLPSLSPEIMPVPGSDPYLGLQEAAELLTNAGYQQGNIYWITDGITMSQAQDLQDLISDMPFTVNILGVGTEEGAPIRQTDGQLVKDQRGQIVIPKLRGQQLKSIASASGGSYRKFTADESDVRALTQQQMLRADAEETDEQTSQDGDQWAELGPWLLLVLLPFAAYAFRRGVLFAVLLTPLLLTTPKPVFAQTSPATVNPAQPPAAEQPAEQAVTKWYEKPFLNADQQGLKEYSAENYQTATDAFESAEWKGTAAYNAGNYEEALKQFSRSDSTEALYNQGNALAQLGELDEAISRYEEVLNREPDNADAKANKTLLEQMKEQQEQEQQQQDQQQDQDKQDQDQQDQNGQDDQNQQQNQDQQQSDSQDSDSQQQDQQQNSNQEQSQQDQQNGQQDESEQDNQQQQDQQSDESEQGEQDEENQQGQQPGEEQKEENEQEARQAQAQAGELTDEEKEKMQRLDNLMKRIPDDPAFLLKRKMQLEAQQRRRQGPPSSRSEW